jgi:transcriptional regulator
MYVPGHFAMDEPAVRDLLVHHGAADLVTATPDGLLATLLPFVFDPDAGERGALLGHVARNNDQWRREVVGEALVIVRGPDAYVSPGWYASKAEHGRVVPTWNYSMVQLTGRARVHEDADWLKDAVDDLVERHESHRAAPWRTSDAPANYIQGQLRAIVGVEIAVESFQGKAKFSQNRSSADRQGVVAGLRQEEAASAFPVADEMELHLQDAPQP